MEKSKKRKLEQKTESKEKKTKEEPLQYETKSNEEITLLTFKDSNNFPSIPIDNTNEEVLDMFLFPLKKEEFMEKIYAKKCFATSNASVKRFKNFIKKFLFSLNLDELLEESPTDGIHIWLKNKENIVNSFQLDDLEKVKILNESGASLYFRAPEELEDFFVRDISYSLGQNFSGFYVGQSENASDEKRGEIETFISKKGKPVFL
jgi:hypothetical protein